MHGASDKPCIRVAIRNHYCVFTEIMASLSPSPHQFFFHCSIISTSSPNQIRSSGGHALKNPVSHILPSTTSPVDLTLAFILFFYSVKVNTKIVLQKLLAIYAAIEQVGTKTFPKLSDGVAEEVTDKPLIDVFEEVFVLFKFV